MAEKEEQKIELKEAEQYVAHGRTALFSNMSSKEADAKSPTKQAKKIRNGISSNGVFAPAHANALPYGMVPFAIGLVLIALVCGPWVQVCRMGTLAIISDFTAGASIDSRIAYAEAWLPVQPAKAIDLEKEVISFCQAKYGLNDPRTAYAKICYAWRLHNIGSEQEAMIYWQEALPVLKGAAADIISSTRSKPINPRITEILHKFGNAYYENGNLSSAISLYQTALLFWDKFPGDGTKTNCEADLATCFENMGDYANAAKYMQMALDVTRSWGNTQYNIYRANNLSKYHRRLKHYDIALKYAEESVAMVVKSGDLHSDFAEDARRQLELSKYAAQYHTSNE